MPSIAASAIDNATPHECPISGRIVNKYIEFYFEAKKTNKFRIEWSEPCLRIVLGFIPRTQRYHLFVCRAAFMNCFLCIFIPPFPVDQKLLFFIIYIYLHILFSFNHHHSVCARMRYPCSVENEMISSKPLGLILDTNVLCSHIVFIRCGRIRSFLRFSDDHS